MCGVFSPTFVRGSITALKDTLQRLQQAVGFMRDVVIVSVDLTAIGAPEIDSLVHVCD